DPVGIPSKVPELSNLTVQTHARYAAYGTIPVLQREPEVLAGPRCDVHAVRVAGQRLEECHLSLCTDPADDGREILREPQVVVWPFGDRGSATPDGELCNRSVDGDSPDVFRKGEPEVPIGASRHVVGVGLR